MIDGFKYQGLRKKLIQELRKKGITNGKVLSAINKVPRHLFFESSFVDFAYQDKAFPIGAGQTISQPYTVAYQSSLLDIKDGDKVLEIGTGSGYQASVLIEMGATVFTIERQKELFDKAKQIFNKLNYRPTVKYGDGYKGMPTYAPFDKIIVTCGAPFLPKELINQLNIGGAMVIPLDSKDGVQVMTRYLKLDQNKLEKQLFENFKFVPFLPKKS